MGTGFYLFVFGATIASIHALDVNRHLVLSQRDPNLNFAEANSSPDVGRISLEYTGVGVSPALSSVTPERITPVSDTEDQYKVVNDYVTESDHVAFISKKISSSNNVGDNGNVFRLRTNVDTDKKLEFMEYTTENTRVNVEEENLQIQQNENRAIPKESNNKQGKNTLSSQLHSAENNGFIPRADLHIHPTNRLKPQVTSLITKGDPVSLHDEISKIDMNVNSEYPRLKLHQGNVPAGTDYVVRNQNFRQESVNGRPIDIQSLHNSSVQRHTSQDGKIVRTQTNKGGENKEGSQRLPKDKNGKEEIPWIWGSDPGDKKNTTEIDIDDRVAFDGSMCPTDYVKVMGVCVQKH